MVPAIYDQAAVALSAAETDETMNEAAPRTPELQIPLKSLVLVKPPDHLCGRDASSRLKLPKVEAYASAGGQMDLKDLSEKAERSFSTFWKRRYDQIIGEDHEIDADHKESSTDFVLSKAKQRLDRDFKAR